MTSPFSSILPLWYLLWRTHQSRDRSQTWFTGSINDVYSISGASKNSDVIVTSPFSSILPLWYRLWRTYQSRHRSQTWCTGSIDDAYLIDGVSKNTDVRVRECLGQNRKDHPRLCTCSCFSKDHSTKKTLKQQPSVRRCLSIAPRVKRRLKEKNRKLGN